MELLKSALQMMKPGCCMASVDLKKNTKNAIGEVNSINTHACQMACQMVVHLEYSPSC